MKTLGVETTKLIENRWQMELDFWIEIESLKEYQPQKLFVIALEFKCTKTILRRRENHLTNLV